VILSALNVPVFMGWSQGSLVISSNKIADVTMPASCMVAEEASLTDHRARRLDWELLAGLIDKVLGEPVVDTIPSGCFRS
jgi:hypothetical protein